ncbi:MAG: DUF1549 domain-containing protein [Planctomycetes bacterium]|nr:DUF1549 domain-containing protein [Planctomycetota bacterium]
MRLFRRSDFVTATMLLNIALVGTSRAATPEPVIRTASASSKAPVGTPRLTFELDVMPVLTAAGCNQGACHGKSRGQNGFQLSLLGFDADFDYNAIVKEARGRRVFPAAADESLLLRKGSAAVSHGGGERIARDSKQYKILRDWIAAGMPRSGPADPVLKLIAVGPEELPLSPNSKQQLTVTARYSDGSTRDVTPWCAYQSSDTGVSTISTTGEIKTGRLPGESSTMIRYMGHIATWNVVIPRGARLPAERYSALPRHNFIDQLVWDKLESVAVLPSGPCSDTTFLRRASLDAIGRMPTPDEVNKFLADTSPNKRAALVDALLARPEYADHWANKWVDLLRPNPYRVGIKATLNYDQWIRDAFRENKPYDQFVRELVTARGSTWRNGAATMFRDRRTPEEITVLVSQLFLGVRLDCARCHHHPFEVWGQDEFYGMAAFFGRVGYKGTGISAPISGGEEMIFTAAKGAVKHPISGAIVPPEPLTGKAALSDDEDPRLAFARWMTANDNPFFARVAVNRMWAELMGRGLVEPVDDLRATNPATNAELLDALGVEFRRLKYDQKAMLRTIMTSYVYGLSSATNDTNVADTQNYSRHYRTRLRAETISDAIADITGVRDDYAAMAPGSRATAIWTHRINSLFLDAFGRPDPNQDPPCERTGETTMVQALHLMNSSQLHQKIVGDPGLSARLAGGKQTPAELVEQLYLSVYSRRPSDAELQAAVKLYTDRPEARRQTTEDLLWAMLNTPEFLFKD